MATRQAWLAVVQRGDEPHEQETEMVTLDGFEGAQIGATIDLGNGERITLTEPAAKAAAA